MGRAEKLDKGPLKGEAHFVRQLTCLILALAVGGLSGLGCGTPSDAGFRQTTDCQLVSFRALAAGEEAPELGYGEEDLSWALRSETLPALGADSENIETNAAGPQTVTFRVSRGEGAAEVLGSACSDVAIGLSVPVRVELSTDNGLLNESFETSLVGGPQFVTVRHSVSFDDLRGGLQASAAADNVSLLFPGVWLSLTPAGSAGSLFVEARETGVGIVSSRLLELLSWPADNPCAGAVPTPREQSGDGSPLDGLTRTWRGSGAQDVELVLMPSDMTCTSEGGEFVPAEATLTLPGGRSLAISGAIVPNDAGVNVMLSWYDTTEEFVGLVGDLGQDLSEYEQIGVGVAIYPDATPPTGSLSIYGNRASSALGCTGAADCLSSPNPKVDLLTRELFPVAAD